MTAGKKMDIVLAGVGGQGVLSIAAVISMAAKKEGLKVRQSEVHGMAQRGGEVQAHLRISSEKIFGDLIPRGGADAIVSMEPLEALRYVEYLKPGAALITASEPVFNIPDYPDEKKIFDALKALTGTLLIEAKKLAKEAGSPYSANMVLTGAVSRKLALNPAFLEESIRERFAGKGDGLVNVNMKAFSLGRNLFQGGAEHMS